VEILTFAELDNSLFVPFLGCLTPAISGRAQSRRPCGRVIVNGGRGPRPLHGMVRLLATPAHGPTTAFRPQAPCQRTPRRKMYYRRHKSHLCRLRNASVVAPPWGWGPKWTHPRRHEKKGRTRTSNACHQRTRATDAGKAHLHEPDKPLPRVR
jgi:hypothetical protein